MTASKSSRARQARAQRSQASAAGTRNISAARNGSAAPNSGTARNGSAARNGGADKPGTAVKASTLVQAGSPARAVATRGGGVDRRGSRLPAREASAELEAPSTTTIPLWFQLTTWVLSLAGLGVSIYLTIAHFTDKPLAGCAESGAINCTKVTTSPQSYVFGIPVAVLGLAFFVAAVALMSPWAWRLARREVALIRLASLVVGVGFVIYLLYAELFIVGAICLYCTSVHVITFLLFVLTAFAAAAWGLPGRQRS
ncbi:MAG TPA: vitamin K epoxide reductase family protein [Streptosporangiaceae bacterium]|nr:vitamin K epoxide reductase family protein [Streptosporangiaceae bacterium]